MTLVSVIVAIIVLSGLMYFVMRGKASKQKKRLNPAMAAKKLGFADRPKLDVALVQNKWRDIQAMQNSGPSGIKNALMEADKLLDYVLRAKGFRGETMADRMRSAGPQLGSVTAVWAAHKLRNMLAHEVEHDIVPNQVKQAVADLGQSIRDLGVGI
ncbi:hypothetical protein HYX70_02845 [Candidatus Saccharibacteria bacterium]|nr:hypothetical protein [Candidatus Saccharibacteria bacterium]